MSQDTINLELTDRTIVRKQLAGLRAEGLVPAVVHDHGKPSLHVQADYLVLSKVYAEAGKHHPIELTVGKEQRLALIKDVDIDPVKNRLRHIVFQAIKQDEKVQTEVPVRIEGDIPAEKTGLMVITNLDHVEIEALPKDLIDELTLSGESLVEIGDKITVAEISVPAGVTILTELEHPVATVEETKAQISEEAEESEEAAEGEEGTETPTAEGEAESSADAPAKEE